MDIVERGDDVKLVEVTWRRLIKIWAAYFIACALLGFLLSGICTAFIRVLIPVNLLSSEMVVDLAQTVSYPIAGLFVLKKLLHTTFSDFRIALVFQEQRSH